jgi:hypothetical protein
VDPLYTTIHWLARGHVFRVVEDGFVNILDRRGDAKVLSGVRRLGEGSILGIHGGEGGGMASP